MPKLCIHWPRFGPLHDARTRAAHEVFAERSGEVVGLEIASDDDVYDWNPVGGQAPYAKETLFPGRNYDRVPLPKMRRAVYDALDRLDPDGVLIHSYSTPDARTCLKWCRDRRRVAIQMAESRAADAERAGWREALKRAIVHEYDAALTSGTQSAAYIEALGLPAHTVHRGYSVVDNELFAARAAEVRADPSAWRHLPGLADDGPFFFASARMIPRKDLPTLMEAYAQYAEAAQAQGRPVWRLVLLGEGPGRPALEAQAARRGVAGRVTFGGWQQIEALPAYYALASAFVHTSTVDPWGLVVNEAMAAGLPVIVSTGAGCAADLVHAGRNGYTFAPLDPDGLAAHLLAVADDETAARMGAASAEIIGEWPLRLFGTGLWDAYHAGVPRSDRGLSPAAALVLGTLRFAARSTRSFHTVES